MREKCIHANHRHRHPFTASTMPTCIYIDCSSCGQRVRCNTSNEHLYSPLPAIACMHKVHTSRGHIFYLAIDSLLWVLYMETSAPSSAVDEKWIQWHIQHLKTYNIYSYRIDAVEYRFAKLGTHYPNTLFLLASKNSNAPTFAHRKSRHSITASPSLLFSFRNVRFLSAKIVQP